MNVVLVHLFMFTLNFVICYCKSYSNFTLYNLHLEERYQIQFLQNLYKGKLTDIKFWQKPYKLDSNIQVLASPKHVDMLEERFQHFSINRTILSRNIQTLFDQQRMQKYVRFRPDSFRWDVFHSLEDIYQWMSDVIKNNSKKAKLKTIGYSVEGRKIFAVEIISNKPKPKVIVEGGIHGNEWLSVEFVTYLTNELINVKGSSPDLVQQIVNKFNWILIPVLNPDGYDYSMKHDRLWRKNRKVFNGSIGVDLNKNFDYSFCKYDGSRKSENDNYCGPTAFSEPETRALRDYVKSNADRLRYYFSFHAYGQNIIIPYSDRVRHIENFSEMENYGKQAIWQIGKMYGVKYGVGTYWDLYGYRSSGDSTSWVKKKYKVKYALAFYLRDNGTSGFAIPAKEIVPACEEMMVGISEVMTVKTKYNKNRFFRSNAIVFNQNFVTLWLLLLLYIQYMWL